MPWRFTIELPDGLAAKVRVAVDRLAEKSEKDPVTGKYFPLSQRRADALVTLASAHIADDADPDRATVNIHVTLEQLESQSGIVDVDGHPTLFQTVADQFCDARHRMIYERDGLPIGIGRMSRDIPPAIRRLLWRRDHGCRFPNCENTKGIEGHHIWWWRYLGETNIDNLILLCPRHHHLIHDKGWQIIGDPNHHVEFRDPEGKTFRSRIPKANDEIINHTNRLLDAQVDGLKLFV